MVRAQYIAGTGMLLQRRNMETITNNIVNADTTGYKKEILVSHSFDDVLVRRINDQTGMPGIGPLNFGTQVDELHIDHTTGSYEETGRSTDMALVGDVYFVVGTSAGDRYTRSGAFVLNENGYLTDGNGNYLMGENGRIYVGGTDFDVDIAGNVSVDGQLADKIRVVSFEDNLQLRKQGGNLYYTDEAPLAAPYDNQIRQGFLESSNVDIGREMVDMISVYRVYETNQRMITMIDETVGMAATEIGRLR